MFCEIFCKMVFSKKNRQDKNTRNTRNTKNTRKTRNDILPFVGTCIVGISNFVKCQNFVVVDIATVEVSKPHYQGTACILYLYPIPQDEKWRAPAIPKFLIGFRGAIVQFQTISMEGHHIAKVKLEWLLKQPFQKLLGDIHLLRLAFIQVLRHRNQALHYLIV